MLLASRSYFSDKGRGPSYSISTMQAAEGGNVHAKYLAGTKGGETKEDKAKWLREAAEQGHSKAQETLASNYDYYKDYEQAVLWYRTAAENGSQRAQYELAKLLDPTKAEGHLKDAEEAVKWYREAANQGDVQALEQLASIYSRPQVEYKELRQAVGLPEPQSKGPGVNNYVTAYAYYSLSAYCDDNPGRQFGAEYRDELVQEMSRGQLKGTHQLKGAQTAYQDLLKEFKERQQEALLEEIESRAAEEKALVQRAEGGDAKAQLALGWKIFSLWKVQQGRGRFLDVDVVPVGTHWDVEEAFEWWRKAAEQGDEEAQYILGVVESSSHDDSIDFFEDPPEAF